MTELLPDVHAITGELVLTERKATSEWKIREILESHENNYVRVDVELGPFTEELGPGGQTVVRGSSGRGLLVWSGDEYIAIRDTWNNDDLIAKITQLLEEQASV